MSDERATRYRAGEEKERALEAAPPDRMSGNAAKPGEAGMKRLRMGRWLAWGTSMAFFATAALHGSAYGSLVSLSEDVPGTLGQLIPMLWLVFSSDLVILGLIIGIVATQPSRTTPMVVAMAALCPLVVAGLQVLSIGFVPPTGLLIGVGVLALVSAAMLRAAPGPEATTS